MKKGFTMIELIFVIVILGILAAVAIPRLAATRDDAGIAKALSEAGTIVSDLGAYYTSQGSFNEVNASGGVSTNDGIHEMTNVLDINASGTDNSFFYMTSDNGSGLEKCIKYTMTSDGNLSVEAVSTPTPAGNICIGLQDSKAFDSLENNTSYGGRKVNF